MTSSSSPRLVLFTGKGGVGKTTVAAATAALAANAFGQRTLLVSTDAAHSVRDALGAHVGTSPTPVTENLFAQHIDGQPALESSWASVQDYLHSVFDAVGVDSMVAEELTVLPGAEEILALLEVRRQLAAGCWDAVVVDCAPTGETLRLLALPEALAWYMNRLFGWQRASVRTLRPLLTRAAGVPMPTDRVFAGLQQLHTDLDEVRRQLTGTQSSVRIVMTPERMVLAESRRAFTSLSLYGYRVDGVVANRVFPDSAADPWRARWVAQQAEVLAETADSFKPLPIWPAAYLPQEPVGVGELDDFGRALYADKDPLGATPPLPLRAHTHDGGATLTLALGPIDKGDVELNRRGNTLIVTIGGHRRVLSLPESLRAMDVAGAGVRAGSLRVRFRSTPITHEEHQDTHG